MPNGSEAGADLPICLACYRQGISMTEPPPISVEHGWQCEDCPFHTFEQQAALAHSDEEKHSLARSGQTRRAWPEEICVIPSCQRRTNNGIYVDAATVEQVTRALA